MKAFEISRSQVAAIICGLIADELAGRFKRHTDFLTLASWSAETALGDDGLGLTEVQRVACAQCIARFFGFDPAVIEKAAAPRVDDWAAIAESEIRASLLAFRFTPAGRDSATQNCLHRADSVFRDAAAAANLLYGRRRMISLIAPHGFLGFVVTVLTPNLQRIPVIDARGVAPDALTAQLAFGDVVVATPTVWRYLMSEGVRAPDNAMGVFFGETAAPELISDLRKAGFGALRELYGSTENGLIGWRDSPSEPFVLFDHWRRAGNDLARPGGESVSPMDEFEWVNDRTFRLGRRRDGAVQIGAVNVFPERIASVIGEHGSVEACTIEVATQAGGVNRLIARIKLNPEFAPSEFVARDIDSWCRRNLRPQERPRIYNFEAMLD